MKHKALGWGATGFNIVLWMFVALISYWSFLDATPPFISQIQHDEQVVKRGNVIPFRSTVDYLRICEIRQERRLIKVKTGEDFLIGHNRVSITKEQVGISKKDHYVTVFIPASLEPGQYKFYRLNYLSCNPIQKLWPVTMKSTPTEFTVTL